jgi:hypothetical protein
LQYTSLQKSHDYRAQIKTYEEKINGERIGEKKSKYGWIQVDKLNAVGTSA